MLGCSLSSMPEQPSTVSKENKVKTVSLHVFALGLLWAMLTALAPVGVVILDWTARWSDPPDPTMLWHLGLTCALGGGVAFWRKHKALLKLPPDLVMARDLAQQVTTDTVTTTTTTATTTVQVVPTTAAEPLIYAATYVKAGAPDLVVKTAAERDKAMADGYTIMDTSGDK